MREGLSAAVNRFHQGFVISIAVVEKGVGRGVVSPLFGTAGGQQVGAGVGMVGLPGKRFDRRDGVVVGCCVV